MIIKHFSDWHGNIRPVSWADLYIITGDMCKNYPTRQSYEILPEREARCQKEWLMKVGPKFRATYLENKKAPIIVIRGNHDFTELKDLVGGEVYEIGLNSKVVYEILGLKVGGFRGIPYIDRTSLWADQVMDPEADILVRNMPLDLDIIVTHAPPAGILADAYGYDLGMSALSNYATRVTYEGEEKERLFCFGHIHEHGGEIKVIGNNTFSNAATTVNTLEIFE